MKVIHQRILALIGLISLVATLGILAHHYSSLRWLIAEETYLLKAVQANPVRYWLLGFALYVGLSLIPGTAGKSVIAGWLFGFWAGVLLVDLALTTAAMATFFASRFIFREAIESRFGVQLNRFRIKMQSEAGFYLLSLRLLHTPYSALNYVSGATSIVPASTFLWTTQVGLLPSTMVFVCVGTRVPRLSVVAEKGPIALLDGSLMAALLGISILPFILRTLITGIRKSCIRAPDVSE